MRDFLAEDWKTNAARGGEVSAASLPALTTLILTSGSLLLPGLPDDRGNGGVM